MVILEASVETLEEARAAEAGGAARLELCANLTEQGTTPDDALLAAVVEAVRIPVFAMVRPRAGSFVYTPLEMAAMEAQVERALAVGAHGIVTGALTKSITVDLPAMRSLLRRAAGLPVTFHRAFDLTPDRAVALETLVALGVTRVLTSGGKPTAVEGSHEIAWLVQQAAQRITIVAGGGVRAHNVEPLVARTGVTEVHAHLATADEVREIVGRVRSAGRESE